MGELELRTMKVTASLLLAAFCASSNAMELDASNFDAEVVESGKNAFVKFLAPW